MRQFSIELDPATLEPTKSGALVGSIHVRVCGVAFPAECWNDFVIVVLSWWCEAVLQIKHQTCSHVELDFMDGPFSMMLYDSGERNEVILKPMTRRESKALPPAVKVPVEFFQHEVLAAATKVLCYCSEHRLDSADITKLRMVSARLTNDF